MTATETGEGKRASGPDLSYVPLQGGAADVEERAQSEESQLGNNNNRSTAGDRGALIFPQDRRGPSVLRSNLRTPNGNSTAGHELAPLNKDPEEPEDPDAGASGKLTLPACDAEPPDGGVRAWSIMIASFLINGILFGIMNTYSIVYNELQAKLAASNETEASSKASLVGSLTIGTTFLLSPVASILTDEIGVQITTFVGGALASLGMLLSSIFYDKVEVLYLTYGVMYGMGASLAYTPSLVILGHYFKRYIGLVNGVVTAGSSVFTILIPYVMQALITHVGLEGWFRCLAALTAVVMACALLFKPILPPSSAPIERSRLRSNFRGKLKELVNVSIWKQKRYVIWASAIPLALFGYFVPYVHIGKFVEKRFVDTDDKSPSFIGADAKLPVMCIGLTSGVGRLLFGYIADKPRVNRILLQQISFITIGVLTMLLPVTESFTVLLIISLGMGLVDGCFISLLGPIAFEMCGRKNATQAIGFLLGMCSIPLTAGPPIAGLLFDHLNSYDLAFYLAGIPPIVGAIAMFAVRCVKDERTAYGGDGTEPSNQSRRPLAQSAWQNGNGMMNKSELREGRARKERWKYNGEGDYVGRWASERMIGFGARRAAEASYRYDYDDYRFFLRRDYQRPKIYEAVTCGSRMCPHRGCELANRDIPRYSESEPLLFGTNDKSVSRYSSDAGWHGSFAGIHGKRNHRRIPPEIYRFSERRIYDDQKGRSFKT